MSILSSKNKVEQLLGSFDHQQILKAMARSAVEAALAGGIAGKGAEQANGGEGSGAGRLREGAARLLEGDGDGTTGLREGAAKLLDGDDKRHRRGRKLGPGIAAAGAAVAVTAASAAVSAARRRSGGS